MRETDQVCSRKSPHVFPSLSPVSLENVLLDVRELGKGMDLIRRECSLHDHSVLKGFVQASDAQLDKLQKDAKTAEVSVTPSPVSKDKVELFHRSRFLTRGSSAASPSLLLPQEAFNNVVNYFGESAKTAPPSVFFPVFVRFIKAYKVSRCSVWLC